MKAQQQILKEWEALRSGYYTKVSEIFDKELEEIFLWFKERFPKRRLSYVDGMGTNYFKIDDIYYIDDYCQDIRERYMNDLLEPLYTFIETIQCNNFNEYIEIGSREMDRFAHLEKS